jgi:hypothetical protein
VWLLKLCAWWRGRGGGVGDDSVGEDGVRNDDAWVGDEAVVVAEGRGAWRRRLDLATIT